MMEAGRELDVLIAEKVMQWTHRTVRNPVENYWQWSNAEGKDTALLPHFSTDMAAAWQVLEELRKKKWSIEISDNGAEAGWNCSIFSDRDSDGKIMETWQVIADEDAATVSLAICLAALKAVGVNVDELQKE